MTDPLLDGDPAQVGPYTLHARLGGGGMGQVFLGRSPGGHTVAVKVVRPELAQDPDFRRRFATEVAAARKVGGFYTAQVVDADTDATAPWLATAYIPGPTLHRAVADRGPLPTDSVTVLGAGLAEGLAAVHAQGLVHRDLKPANVLLAADGPRVIDFGIARALDSTSHTHSSTVLGTAAFMSPEQARAEKVGPASDVFSLGCVLTFAATGRSPFGEGPSHAVGFRVVHEEPDLAGLPAPLVDLVRACLAKASGSRPGVEEVMAALAAGAPSRPGDGQWLPPDITEALSRHTLAYTRVQAPQTPPAEMKRAAPERPPLSPERVPAKPTDAELVIGNLTLNPLAVLVDGAEMGTVPAGERGSFPVESGKHTVQVGSGEQHSMVRRIGIEPRGTTRMAFDVGTGSNTQPEPVEEVVFKGRRGVADILVVILVLAGIVFLGLVISRVADLIFPWLGGLSLVGTVGVAIWMAGATVFEGPPSLGLRDSELTAGAEKGPGKLAASWQDLTQVSMVGEGSTARLVVWTRKVLPKFTSLEDFQGGKVVCVAKEVGVAKHHDTERLRAALRWFADDLWVEQPPAP
ncbi:serine/threonine-protein kinase [Nocardiopsis ganjiahuensis]|uniref:serine/threonine-protein kinase n=1 Tax=Nocardiopsis ganjiahuensis TaxID=239984 RepID=UPI000687F4F8|nr:serine/threonine-protein kinase [Nocardiopsis ganjiahuensis]